MQKPQYDYSFRILLLGKRGVGKSSLIYRFTKGIFSDNFILTFDNEIKILNIENKTIIVRLHDIHSGGERFKIMSENVFKNMQGFILTYDITERDSFNQIEKWFEEIELKASSDSRKILVGSKCDKNLERKVSKEEGKNLADKFNMNFFEISAKTGYNVNEAIENLIKDIFESNKQNNLKK